MIFDWGTLEPLFQHFFAAVVAAGLGIYIVHGNTMQFLDIIKNAEELEAVTRSQNRFSAFLKNMAN